MLVTTDATLPAKVEHELAKQLATFPQSNADTARAALINNGYAFVAANVNELISIVRPSTVKLFSLFWRV